MNRLFLLSVICAVIAGCGSDYNSGGLVVPLEELKTAPTELSYGGNTVVLTVGLNRDFMPGSPAYGTRLTGIVSINTPALRPDLVWVINGDEVWQTEGQSSEGYYLVTGGPKWDTGILVDVVVRLIDEQGSSYLLRVSGVMIQRSD